jgi:hypothetical protein
VLEELQRLYGRRRIARLDHDASPTPPLRFAQPGITFSPTPNPDCHNPFGSHAAASRNSCQSPVAVTKSVHEEFDSRSAGTSGRLRCYHHERPTPADASRRHQRRSRLVVSIRCRIAPMESRQAIADQGTQA